MKKSLNVLIVFAHAEPKSFCSAIKDLCEKTLKDNGHTVKVSDLYKMKMILPLDKTDFLDVQGKTYFKPQDEERFANKEGDFRGFTPELKQEHEKVKWANLILFIYPLYWFHMPGIMKNWIDRVFSAGFAYSGYDLNGRKAMVLFTTGGPKEYLDPYMGPMMTLIHECIFEFTKMSPLEPFIAYAAAHVTAQKRKEYLDEVKKIMDSIETRGPYKKKT